MGSTSTLTLFNKLKLFGYIFKSKWHIYKQDVLSIGMLLIKSYTLQKAERNLEWRSNKNAANDRKANFNINAEHFNWQNATPSLSHAVKLESGFRSKTYIMCRFVRKCIFCLPGNCHCSRWFIKVLNLSTLKGSLGCLR